MAEQDAEVAQEQDQPVATGDRAGAGEGVDTDAAVTTDDEDDDTIDDLEFLIDDIEDQIAPLGL